MYKNRNRISSFEVLEDRRLLTIAFELLVDTNTSTQSLVRSPSSVVDFGDSVAFIAETGTSNPTLWLSPDAQDQALMEIELPGEFYGGAHFRLGDDLLINGYSKVPEESGLWRTDGTFQGTERISGTSSSSIVTADSIGYFIGRASEYDGFGLWQTDGTPSGTRKLVTEAGEQGIRFSSPLSVLNDRLYLIVTDDQFDRYLATFDVSSASIRPLIAFPRGQTVQIESLSDRLIVSNDPPGTGRHQKELYSFKPSSKELIKLPEAPGFHVVQTGVLSRLSDEVVFPRYDGVLIATDGTVEGTREFFDFEFMVAKRQPNIASIADNFLVAGYGPQGYGYYFTDGTAANTDHVGLAPYRHPYHPPIATSRDAYYVYSEDVVNGAGLYRIDAFDGSFDLAADIANIHSLRLPGPFSDFGNLPAAVGNRVLFSDTITGVAVLREYGPESGSIRTLTTGEGTQGNEVSWLANDDQHVWFESAGKLWQSSGTPDTTFELAYAGEPLYVGRNSLAQVIDGKLMIEAPTSTFRSPYYRWQVDPSTGKPIQLGELQNAGFSKIFKLEGNYYQLRNVDSVTAAIFALDENFVPSRRIADIPTHNVLAEVHLLGDRALFIVDGELWQTDGTQTRSHRLNLSSDSDRAAYLRSDASGIVYILTAENQLYQLTEGIIQPEIVAEVPLRLDDGIGLPNGLVLTNETAEVHQGLWIVDRTTGSTEMLADFAGRARDVDAGVIGLAGGKVIAFSGSDTIGYSLWATDGTKDGTTQIAYERYGSAFWLGRPNVSANTTDGRLVLSWYTQDLGRELFITDGSVQGTLPLSDIAVGPHDSDPQVAILGDLVLATGATDEFGRWEPFVGEVPPVVEQSYDRLRFFVPERAIGAEIGSILPADLSLTQIIEFTLVGSISGAEFEIDQSLARLSLSEGKYYEYELVQQDEITVDVAYLRPGDTEPTIRRVTVTVEILDQLEKLSIEDQVFEIDENSRTNQFIGKIEATFDAQLGVSFFRTGGHPFFVDRDTGHVFVMNADHLLDFEARQEFLVSVQVSDGLETKQSRLTIRLRDVNEAPEPGEPIGGIDFGGFDFVSGETTRITFGANVFRDPEGSKISYRLEQRDSSVLPDWMVFDPATTELAVSPAHSDTGDHLLTLIATDATGLASIAKINVRVFSGLAAWHNLFLPFDVNDDGFVSPIDALIVINQLNFGTDRLAETNPQLDNFVDTDADRVLAPADALLVINFLNERSGEGEVDHPKQLGVPPWSFVWWERLTQGEWWERRRDRTHR